MKIYGHRGASGHAPENTMPAFQLAAEMGAQGIELDVQLTKDHELVIFHDGIMKRTARWKQDVYEGANQIGKAGEAVEGWVKDYTLAQVQSMEVGSWMDEKWSGTPIPTMEEVYQWMQTNKMEVNIEIKVSSADDSQELTEKTLAMAAAYGVTDRLLISSFCHPALVTSHECQPEIPTGILYSELFYHPEAYAKVVGAQALHPHFIHITPEDVQNSHHEGVLVNVWTPNSQEELQACIAMQVDGIITNYPDRALALLA